jgi:hypothetical protein
MTSTLRLIKKLHRSQNRKRSIAKAIGLAAIATLLVGFIIYGDTNRKHLTRASFAGATTTPQTAIPDDPSDIQALLFEVRPFGFTPSELGVPAGRYLIVLSNRTGRSDLSFRLDREGNGRVSESRPNRRDWKEQVQLLEGNYTLTEANNPSWSCSIRVTAR